MKRTHSTHHRRPRKTVRSKLSSHFSKRDFVCSESGQFKISLGLVGALEHLRSKVNQHITIIKGYESSKVAEKKGATKRNFHAQGLAADIRIESLCAKDAFLLAETIPEFIGIGLNIKEDYIHVDTRKAERLCWVEENNDEVELTDKNRKKYLGDA